MKKLRILTVLLLLTVSLYGQVNVKSYSIRDSVGMQDTVIRKTAGNPTKVFVYSLAAFLYLLNPDILYENNKIALGITKEVSVGFGYFGENRITLEYSVIFRSIDKGALRAGFSKDFLLSNLQPSNNIQTSAAVSPGISYFTNFSDIGISFQTAYGYSIRNHKILIYPHVKLRYTEIFSKSKSNIFDFSFGIMIGIANPFKDLHIRRSYD